jgi:hypothetical protein
MANVVQAGSAFVDTDGAIFTTRVKVAYIVYTPAAANDPITFYDSASTTANQKLVLKGATAGHSLLFDFSAAPILFQNGIYVDITASGTATVVFTSKGESI